MIYCKKCGSEINENNKFCVKCGTPVANVQPEKPEDVKTEKVQAKAKKAPPKPKKVVDEKTKKKRKIIAILASVVLILGFTGYKVGESLTSQDKIIEQFIAAVSEKDTEQLAKLIKSSDIRLEYTEENLKPFIYYIDENPSYFDRLGESLKDQSRKIKNPDKPDRNDRKSIMAFSEEDNLSKSMIFLRKKGKKYFIYDNYEIVMQPFYVNIRTNHSDVTIYMDDEELDKSTSANYVREFGPVAPGKYILKGVYEGEYTTVEEKQDIELILYNSGEMMRTSNYDLNMEMEYIYIDSNYYDAHIIIDGKDIGLTVEDVMDTGLGPVGDGTMVQLSKEFPWGTITTEEETVEYNGGYMGMFFEPVNEKLQEDIMETVNTFLHDDIEALTARDESIYTNVIDPLYNDRTMSIDNLILWGEKHRAVLNSATYDLNSLSIQSNYDDYNAVIKCRTDLGRGYYQEDVENPEELELGYGTNTIEYRLTYDQNSKKWMIYDLKEQYYFDDSNTKEFDFEK